MKKMFFTGNFKVKCCMIFFLFTTPFSSFSLHAQTWSALGTGLNGSCNALTVYNGNLIAGGGLLRQAEVTILILHNGMVHPGVLLVPQV